MVEYLIVALIVAGALVFMVRRFTAGKGCGCGHEATCPSASGKKGSCCGTKHCG